MKILISFSIHFLLLINRCFCMEPLLCRVQFADNLDKSDHVFFEMRHAEIECMDEKSEIINQLGSPVGLAEEGKKHACQVGMTIKEIKEKGKKIVGGNDCALFSTMESRSVQTALYLGSPEFKLETVIGFSEISLKLGCKSEVLSTVFRAHKNAMEIKKINSKMTIEELVEILNERNPSSGDSLNFLYQISTLTAIGETKITAAQQIQKNLESTAQMLKEKSDQLVFRISHTIAMQCLIYISYVKEQLEIDLLGNLTELKDEQKWELIGKLVYVMSSYPISNLDSMLIGLRKIGKQNLICVYTKKAVDDMLKNEKMKDTNVYKFFSNGQNKIQWREVGESPQILFYFK